MDNHITVYPSGKLVWKHKEYRCALGRGGVLVDKKEGDGATPSGQFPIREVYYRADRLDRPQTSLPVFATKEDFGWCDDVSDPNYNRFVQLPYPASHEKLWREDEIYDVVVVLGYNDDPVVPGKGSAIFMHLARPEFTPTDGCVALGKDDLLEILKTIDRETMISIET